MITPIQVKQAVASVIDSLQNDTSSVHRALAHLDDKIHSEEFVEYRRNFGKLTQMIPKEYPGVLPKNVYYANFVETFHRIDYMNTMRALGEVNSKEFWRNLACLYGCLSIMELHHEDIDEAFRRV
ncbi:hypothetical protein HYW20_02485 [Candidatus Woesearchaeota archaeon]|nr:hypothetical protein [Candidatus Woesearchaeota archaeon]